MASGRGGGGGWRPPPGTNPLTPRISSNPPGSVGPGRSLIAKRDFKVDQIRQKMAEKAAGTLTEGIMQALPAEALEFTGFHGTSVPYLQLEDLDPKHAVETEGAIFFTSNEDMADSFTLPREYGEVVYEAPTGEYDEYGTPLYEEIESGPVLKASLRIDNPLVIRGEEAQRAIDDTAYQGIIMQRAKSGEYDGVIFKNVTEFADPGIRGDVYAVFDKSQIQPQTSPQNVEEERESIRKNNYELQVGDSLFSEERRDNAGLDVATGEPWIPPSQSLLDHVGLDSLEATKTLPGTFYKKLNFPKIGDEEGNVSPGRKVAVRPNLNFSREGMDTEGVMIHTLHDGHHTSVSLGTVYGAVLKDPEFLVTPRSHLQVQAHKLARLPDDDPRKIPKIEFSKPKFPLSSVQGELVDILEVEDSVYEKINRNGIIARFNPETTNLYVVKMGDQYHAIKSVKGKVTLEGNRVYIPPESTIQFYTPQELEEKNLERDKIAKDLGLKESPKSEWTEFAHGGFVDKPLYERNF